MDYTDEKFYPYLSIDLAFIAILSLILASSSHALSEYNNRQVQLLTNQIKMNFIPYENSTFGIKLQYPSDWKKVEDDRGVWFRTTNESVNLRVEILPYLNQPLDNLTTRQINLTKQQFPGQVLVELNSTIFGQNYFAHKLVFTFPEEPYDQTATTYKEMQVWTIRDGRAYIISYFTTADEYNNYFPIIQKIVDSFEITPYSPMVLKCGVNVLFFISTPTEIVR